MALRRNTLALGFLMLFMLQVTITMGYEDEAEMEKVLNQLVKQNEMLQKQMTTITTGLTEICRAVNIATCDCDQSRETESQIVGVSDELKLLTLASRGKQDGKVQLTFKFEATDGYGLEWMQSFSYGGSMMRSHGMLEKTKLMKKRFLYESNLQVHDIDITWSLFVRIYSLDYTAIIDVNLTAIGDKGEQKISQWEREITKYPRQVVIPKNLKDDYNLTISVARSALELQEKKIHHSLDMSPEFFVTLINTTTQPATIAEYYKYDGISASQNDEGSGDIEIVFTIPKEYLENGGLFSYYLPHVGEGFIKVLRYGVMIEIVREDHMAVFPPGTLALYKGKEEVYAQSSVFSVTCSAMGNPAPQVAIFKQRGGQLRELKAETLITDRITTFKSVTFNTLSKKSGSPFGTYICRASNGNETIETRTNLLRYKPIKFDERKTGVTVNTTDKVVVTCKASGNPTPELEIRLGSNYGPNLLTAEGNFTSKIKTKGDASKAVITFSPPDHRIDVVYCYVLEKNVHFGLNEREIRIFPETGDWNFDKWSFYNSFTGSYLNTTLEL